MKINEQDLVALINRPVTDPSVRQLLAFAGVAERKLKIKRGESDAAIDCPKHGMVLNFEETDSDQDLPEGALILSAIHAMASGVEGHIGFKGALPLGLTFDLRRPHVSKLLGKADWSSPVLPIDRWNRDGYQVVVEFFDGADGTVASVVVQRAR